MESVNNAALTVDQVAATLSCSRLHVYRLINQGRLKALNIGSVDAKRARMRILTQDLEDFIANAKAVPHEGGE